MITKTFKYSTNFENEITEWLFENYKETEQLTVTSRTLEERICKCCGNSKTEWANRYIEVPVKKVWRYIFEPNDVSRSVKVTVSDIGFVDSTIV